MNIGEKYRIGSDTHNIILYKKHITKKPGEEKWNVVGYYSRTSWALKALVDLEVKETILKDFRQVCEKQEELYKLIDNLNTGGQ